MKNILEIHCELTNKCLLNCKHCSSYASLDKDLFINIDNLTTLLKMLNDRYRFRIVFTGGEPFLFSDYHILNLLREIKSICGDCEIGFFTTGIISDTEIIESDFIFNLKCLGVNFFYLSLYHIYETKHDYITGIKGSYKRTLQVIDYMLCHGIDVRVNLVLNKINIECINEIVAFLLGKGINEVRILKLVKQGRAIENWDDIGIDSIEQYKIAEDLMLNENNKLSYGGFQEFENCQSYLNANKCMAGINKIYINVNNEIYPCGALKNNKSYCMGNLEKCEDIHLYYGNGSERCLAKDIS